MGLDIFFYKLQKTNYFIKYNFLYGFFEKREGWCEEPRICIIYKEDIEELVKRLKTVNDDHSKAEELLPTNDGFFFGSLDYDEYYFECINNCLNEMEILLRTMDEHSKMMVYFSW